MSLVNVHDVAERYFAVAEHFADSLKHVPRRFLGDPPSRCSFMLEIHLMLVSAMQKATAHAQWPRSLDSVTVPVCTLSRLRAP